MIMMINFALRLVIVFLSVLKKYLMYVHIYEFKEKFQRIFVVIENCHRLVVCNGGDLKPDSSFRGSEPLTGKAKSLTYYLSKRVGFILLKIKFITSLVSWNFL